MTPIAVGVAAASGGSYSATDARNRISKADKCSINLCAEKKVEKCHLITQNSPRRHKGGGEGGGTDHDRYFR